MVYSSKHFVVKTFIPLLATTNKSIKCNSSIMQSTELKHNYNMAKYTPLSYHQL